MIRESPNVTQFRLFLSRLAIIFILMVTGCATTYQSKGLTGGYSDTQLDKDVFRINFRGNAYTSGERAQDFVLLRASELTLENNFKYFAIIDTSSSSKITSFTTPKYKQ